jgi:DnaK suppressor protein
LVSVVNDWSATTSARRGAIRAVLGRMTNPTPPASMLSPADLARLRRQLEDKRDALLRLEAGGRDAARGVSDYAIEDGDVAERMVEQQDALNLVAIDDALLGEIDRALRKIEAGNYGVSEDSGEPIGLDRLEAIPWTRRTAAEEERLEAGIGSD